MARLLRHRAADCPVAAGATVFEAVFLDSDFLSESFLAAALLFGRGRRALRLAPLRRHGLLCRLARSVLGYLDDLCSPGRRLFVAAAAFGSVLAAGLAPTRKASRFFAPAIQPGARPKPDQVLPVLGSTYFAIEVAFIFALALALDFFAERLLPTA